LKVDLTTEVRHPSCKENLVTSRPVSTVLYCLTITALAASCARAEKPKPPAPTMRWEAVQLIENLNEGMAIADVNRDKTPDLISGPFWFEGPKWKKHPLRELGLRNEEFLDNNGDHAFDFNGDGWVDVISASWFRDKIYWYENPGKEGLAEGRLWKEHFVTDGQSACEGTMLTDIDGDKNPELIANYWEDGKPATIIRIIPGKDGSMPTFDKIHIGSPGTGHGFGVGDINGDKRKDLLVPHGWFEQPAEKWWETKWTFHQDFKYDHISLPCVITDLTGDGHNDIIMGEAHNYALWWLEQKRSDDGKITWQKHMIDDTFSQAHCLRWVDLDGNGKKELVTGKRWRGHKGRDPGGSDPVGLYRYIWQPKSQTFVKDTITYDQKIGSGMQIRIGDLDNDKRKDIAVAGKSGTYVLYNRGSIKPRGSQAKR
jgi:hypothetical protein